MKCPIQIHIRYEGDDEIVREIEARDASVKQIKALMRYLTPAEGEYYARTFNPDSPKSYLKARKENLRFYLKEAKYLNLLIKRKQK